VKNLLQVLISLDVSPEMVRQVAGARQRGRTLLGWEAALSAALCRETLQAKGYFKWICKKGTTLNASNKTNLKSHFAVSDWSQKVHILVNSIAKARTTVAARLLYAVHKTATQNQTLTQKLCRVMFILSFFRGYSQSSLPGWRQGGSFTTRTTNRHTSDIHVIISKPNLGCAPVQGVEALNPKEAHMRVIHTRSPRKMAS
jgi:hypothetical protein